MTTSSTKSKTNACLNIFYLNARSIVNKIDELRVLYLANDFDIICVVESWLSPEVSDTEIFIPGFNIFRKDRNRHGGGIVVFVKDKLICTVIPFQHNNSHLPPIEFLPLCVEFCNHKFCISTFYRPPSSDVAYFDALLEAVETLNIINYSSFVLTGDFNINFCNSSHPLHSRLINLCNSFQLTQVVSEPTHVTPPGAKSLIDLIFLSHPLQLVHCDVSPPLGISDHNCVNLCISSCHAASTSIKTAPRTIWRYAHADFERANMLLDEINWDELLIGDVDQMWAAWEAEFMSIMHQCIPTVNLSAKQNVPWLHKGLTKAMRARNLAFRHMKRTRRSAHLLDYKRKRNKVANMIKKAKSNYFKKFNPSNPKTFWKATKYLTKKSSTIPTLLDCDGNSVQDDREKATLLNDFFSQCFNHSHPPLSAADYDNLIHPNPDECPSQYLITEDKVLELLLSLDTTKSNGPDGISTTMLKATAASIAHGITKLMNQSISSGKFPSAWKSASVVPIPKGQNHTSTSNYRLISLLSILSKLLEKHIHRLITSHLESHHPIALQQWGFQPKKSTTSALLDVFHNWSKALDQGQEVCAVFFDLQKAFDSVPHRALIEKLKSIDLNPFILRWICSYLTDRSQRVVLNGESSPSCKTISGVPQGSVLGPLLFLIYINDSVEETKLDGNNITLYADDMLLF